MPGELFSHSVVRRAVSPPRVDSIMALSSACLFPFPSWVQIHSAQRIVFFFSVCFFFPSPLSSDSETSLAFASVYFTYRFCPELVPFIIAFPSSVLFLAQAQDIAPESPI